MLLLVCAMAAPLTGHVHRCNHTTSHAPLPGRACDFFFHFVKELLTTVSSQDYIPPWYATSYASLTAHAAEEPSFVPRIVPLSATFGHLRLVELNGIEPMTYGLQSRRSPN